MIRRAPRSAVSRDVRPVGPAWWAWTRARSRRRSTIWICACLALPILLAGTAELIARSLIHHRIESTVARSLGSDADVDISGPALVGLMSRHLDRVDISSTHARLGKMRGASIRAQLNDVRFGGSSGGGSVGGTHVEVSLSADDILNTLASSAEGGLPITSVTPDPASGTLRLGVGGGMARIDIRPELSAGRVEFGVIGAEVMGRPAPEAALDRLRDSFGSEETQEDDPYPLGLKATDLAVTEGGVGVTLDGGQAELDAS
ncbi:DUF2993 domain-containing protein [Streptomyces sp. NPDC090106]|uniref:LmeA family phospholipid-binding protein n=1 Tax=Streptomyces sp. NPDC090106 TaxID=3365946 RepID=UPI00381738F5